MKKHKYTYHPVRDRIASSSIVWVLLRKSLRSHSLVPREVGKKKHPHESERAALYLYQYVEGDKAFDTRWLDAGSSMGSRQLRIHRHHEQGYENRRKDCSWASAQI
jgi:hypothetical protein